LNLDENIQEFIDLYLEGKLDENHPFVQRLKVDEELALEVEVQKLIPDAVVDYRLMEVEKMVSVKKTQFLNQKPTNWNKTILSVSALVIGVLSFLYFNQEKEVIPTKTQQNPIIEKEVSTVSSPKQEEKINDHTLQVVVEKPKAKENVVLSSTKEKETEIVKIEKEIQKTDVLIKEETKIENKISSPEKEKDLPKVALNPCSDIKIKGFIDAEKPHFGKSDGQISISNTKGGEAPYRYSIDGKVFQDENNFEGLKAGNYSIFVKDKNACTSLLTQNYVLQNQMMEFVFNPNESKWDAPIDVDKGGQISIINKSGQLVYLHNFGVSEECVWSGETNLGGLAEPGMYIYKINYSDGGVDQGKITVVY